MYISRHLFLKNLIIWERFLPWLFEFFHLYKLFNRENYLMLLLLLLMLLLMLMLMLIQFREIRSFEKFRLKFCWRTLLSRVWMAYIELAKILSKTQELPKTLLPIINCCVNSNKYNKICNYKYLTKQ
jgi:hypothetical protein